MGDELIPIQPIQVAMIGGTGTGTGDGSAPLKTGTIAETSGTQPNLVVRVVQPIVALVVRFIHLFLTVLSGLITAALLPYGESLLPFSDFSSMVTGCATLAATAATAGLIKDLVTVFGRLEGRFPLLTGNI